MEESKQHVQLPNRKPEEQITPKDQLIYVTIRRYMNNKTLEAFPSQKLVSEKSGASVNTIKKCISNLETLGYIQVIDNGKGRNKIYKFIKPEHFEAFSYEFLDNPNLSFLEKTYIVASQQFMFTDGNDGKGSLSYTNKELSKKINMSESNISRCNKSLETKGYLTILENQVRDLETGCKTKTKIFHLDKIGQQIVFVLKNHEERLCNVEDSIELNSEKIALLEKENAQLKKSHELLYNEIYELKKLNKKEIIID